MCPLSSRQTKKQKDLQKKISFISPCCAAGGDFSSRDGGEIILAWRHAIKTLLVSTSIVKENVILNS